MTVYTLFNHISPSFALRLQTILIHIVMLYFNILCSLADCTYIALCYSMLRNVWCVVHSQYPAFFILQLIILCLSCDISMLLCYFIEKTVYDQHITVRFTNYITVLLNDMFLLLFTSKYF